jgi:hypothetical protein
MRVLYSYEARLPFPPGRMSEHEMEMDIEDLPPLAKREIDNNRRIEDLYGNFYEWKYAGGTILWWISPLK